MLWLQKILLEKPETPQRQIEQHKLEAIGEFAESQTCRRLVLPIILVNIVKRLVKIAIFVLTRQRNMMV